ncbi:tetratricopeptide (TPR) repeat protein [Elusimicrobium posterum]|uniref:tetratricopeptide repeat protein n=1 Tax=Elusimicrobium posterum TaxID=3116653 RepID=UPI003C77D79A
MAKKSPKHIKANVHEHDYITGALVKIFKFIRSNKTAVTVTLVAVIAVALGASFYCYHSSSVKENSWKEVYMATQFGTPDAMAKTAEDFKGTDAGYYAIYTEAEKAFNSLDYKKAAELYAQAAQNKNKEFAAIAHLSEGVALQSAGEHAKAIETAQNFIKTYPQHFGIAQAYLTKALSQELSGAKDEAIATYTQMESLFANTYFGTFAANKLKKIK